MADNSNGLSFGEIVLGAIIIWLLWTRGVFSGFLSSSGAAASAPGDANTPGNLGATGSSSTGRCGCNGSNGVQQTRIQTEQPQITGPPYAGIV